MKNGRRKAPAASNKKGMVMSVQSLKGRCSPTHRHNKTDGLAAAKATWLAMSDQQENRFILSAPSGLLMI
jgi:hypothetical protein